MQDIIGSFGGLAGAFAQIELLDVLVIAVNLLLFIFAPRVLAVFSHEPVADKRFIFGVALFRLLNVLFFLVYGNFYILEEGASGIGLTLIELLAILYLAYAFVHVADYFILLRFGKTREVEGEKRQTETYNSRLLGIFMRMFVFTIVLISCVRLLGFEDSLQAGGAIGFIGVFLALTQGSWAPDIFSGLIILNSSIFEEGDVVEIDSNKIMVGIIFKTKMFHTEILNLANNHRVMIRNAVLRDYVIHNLSRFASAKGLREKLVFNISYEEDRVRVREMFMESFSKACEEGVEIEAQHEIEIGVDDASDYAISWCVFYYTKNVKKLLLTRMRMKEIFADTAKKYDIGLDTPMLNKLVN